VRALPKSRSRAVAAGSGGRRLIGARGWALCGLVIGILPHAGAAELPPSVERVLRAHRIDADQVSIVVQAVGMPAPILSHLPDVPRNPASVMKVITTWAGLEILGPAYTWPTEVHLLGDFDGRRLDGELALKGYGDPFLVQEEMWKMLRALRRLGLEEIDGGLLLDDSFFHVDEPDPGAFDSQPYRAYNVLPNALLMNFQAVSFQFVADRRAGRVRISPDPVLANLRIENRVELVDGPCRGYQAGISFNVRDPASVSNVAFAGRFPARCGSYALTRAVLRHDTFALGLIESLWREVGGAFKGGVRRGTVPEATSPVLVWRSPPLADLVRAINKNSNNVMTRQLLYTLGAEALGAPATRDKGVRAVRAFLAASGFDIDDLVIDNGAGLSRQERTTARLLADVLRAAHASVYAPEFISSLSLAGLDGTTRSRFDGHSGAGRMHVKTGRIDHVAAIAGFVHAGNGTSYVVVILLNADDAHRGPGYELQDAVLDWVHAQP
jgi:serine-type D-Ala-D-Ala carboxypeptidase/endopeptidase (penicillin-binding protein 4)